MTTYFRTIFTERSTWVLFFLSLFSIAMVFVRYTYTSNLMYIFMVWNLFLAFVPWYLATFVRSFPGMPKPLFFLFLLVWLAVLPNAPYMLTDFIHLGIESVAA